MRQLVALPPEMARLPRDHRGYPIPAFVYFDEHGKEDFRIIKRDWREVCFGKRRCWLCGGFMGRRKWFVIGPMCSITRTTMEPPSHRMCAEFAVKNCPFLTQPLAKYSTKEKPVTATVAGEMITRNPGVTLIWECTECEAFADGRGSWLITVGEPLKVTAWREGRHASRDELLASINSGLPALEEMAARQGVEGLRALARTVEEWDRHVLDRFFPVTTVEEVSG